MNRVGHGRGAFGALTARAVTFVVSLAAVAMCSGACTGAAAMRGKVRGLEGHLAEAEKRGAMKCAPRELALAKSHLHFAAVELDQGELSNAEAHLQIAEPNANAAYDNSPPDRCTSREFVDLTPKAPPKPGDRDGDGILDNVDECKDDPETYNGYKDEDGCPDDPDTDSDGIADSMDQCLLEPEDKDGYLDADGCPDLDNDADGIPDDKDKSADGKDCRNDPEDFDGFQDDDGCPDPDNDGDGVADTMDACPNTPGYNGGDKPGCPKKNSAVVVTKTQILITQQIQFEFNRAVIRPVSFKILDEVVGVLKDNPQITLEIQGHTDNVGSAQVNKALSQFRADAVRKYFVAKGIAANRLVAKGYGMDRPMVPNDTPANRELNRRVQFIRTESGTTP
jgi:outer membrane protein OmpA-like peptidoglycan-associated protein